MRDPFLFVLLLMALIFTFQIIKHKLGIRSGHRGHGLPDARANDEALRLRDELKQLKERLAVLERITVEKENSLSREIESLRDRP